MNVLVTGAAGFIGSNLTDRLLADGHSVRGFDNFSTGRREFLATARSARSFALCNADLLDLPKLKEAMTDVDTVFHLAANADVRHGPEHPRKDLDQKHHRHSQRARSNEGMWSEANRVCLHWVRIRGAGRVSRPRRTLRSRCRTSLYAASKLAAEGLIAAYCEAFGMQSWIFRFVSILGERYTHGTRLRFLQTVDAASGDASGAGQRQNSGSLICTSRTVLTPSYWRWNGRRRK